MNPKTSFERKLRWEPLVGKKVVVACSGGKDSIALLSCLCGLREELSLTLFAAHFNHGLRGEESDRDEKFVASFCEKEGVPLFLGREDVKAFAKEKKLSLEAAAREVRYRFLFSVSKDADWILTAHTASDQAETVLFRLIRGSGLKGLRGILETRGKLFRPMLSITEEEVREYLTAFSIPYVEDSTNACESYTRNRIRHRILPEIRKINPSFEDSVLRLAASASEDEEYLSSLAEDGLKKALLNGRLRRDVLISLPLPVAKTGLVPLFCERGAIGDLGWTLSGERLASKTGKPPQYRRGVFAFRRGKLLLSKRRNYKPVSFLLTPESGIWKETCGFVKENEIYRLRYRLFSAEEWASQEKIHKNYYIFSLNYDTIHGKLFLRNRIPGDRIRLEKRRNRTLKKLFSETHLSPKQRRETLLLSDEMGGLLGGRLRAR